MNMKIPVLKKNDSWEEHQEKVVEENFELFEAIENLIVDVKKEHILHVAEEAFDVIEVALGILDKLEQEHKGIIEKANLIHIKKLAGRGWSFKKVLEIREM